MPVYVYERPDGSRFELRQGFTEDSLTADPETGVPVRRVLQPAPIIFKGSGWYKTDSRPTTSDTSASSEPTKKTDGDSGDTKADASPTTEKAVSEATAKVSGDVKAATEKPAAAPAAKPAATSTPAKSSSPAAS